MTVTSSVFSDANSQHTHYFWNNEYNDPGYQACTKGANFSLSQILFLKIQNIQLKETIEAGERLRAFRKSAPRSKASFCILL